MTTQLPAKAYEDIRVKLNDPRVRKVLAGTGAALLFAYGLYRKNLTGILISGISAYAAMRIARAQQERRAELERTEYGDDIIDVDVN
jgi:uncharacterized membrane protein